MVATHGLVAICATRAAAESAPVRVQLEAAACPSPSELEDELEPLLDRDLDVSDHPANSDVRVIDRGATFIVEVAGVERHFGDIARDCVERARQAAVFITLNLKPAAPEPPEADVRDSLRLGVQASGELAYAKSQDHLAPGPGVGLWLEYGSFRFVFGASLLFASDIEVQSEKVGGAAGFTRIPLVWTGGYQLRLGRLAFGPALGVGLDLLHLRGEDVSRAQTKLRANVGVIAAVELALQLSATVSAIARVGLSAFPREYSLSIAPLGPGGHTPKLWLSAGLGVSWLFAD
jgi:hypothetical protein